MISILKAEANDILEVRELLQSARGDTSNISFEQFVVAKDNDKLIGCVRIKKLEDEVLELASLAVEEEYRGQGIGKKLVEEVLKQQTKRPVYLMCFKDRKGFYDKVGFEEIEATTLSGVLKNEYVRVVEILKERKDEILVMAMR